MGVMNKDQFMAKWMDTHTEMAAWSVIDEGMSSKKIAQYHKDKKEIDRTAGEKRLEKLSELLTDAVVVRQDEILSKDDLPMKDLLHAVIRSHPQRAKIENTGNVNFTFADMVARSSITLQKVEDIDAEYSE